MPSTIGTLVTANYLKARPTTRISTRQLAFFRIELSGIATNYENSDSDFSQVVRGVQAVAEVFAIGRPLDGNLIVVVGADTTSGDNTQINSLAQTMTTAIDNSTGGSSTVTEVALDGNGFSTIEDGTLPLVGSYSTNGDGVAPPYENEGDFDNGC
jgi:hypothetical protein